MFGYQWWRGGIPHFSKSAEINNGRFINGVYSVVDMLGKVAVANSRLEPIACGIKYFVAASLDFVLFSKSMIGINEYMFNSSPAQIKNQFVLDKVIHSPVRFMTINSDCAPVRRDKGVYIGLLLAHLLS